VIPDSIDSSHIRSALKVIDTKGVPSARRSTRYDLIQGNKKYPPKYVISVAYRVQSGKEWPASNFTGGDQSNNFLIARGFRVVRKDGSPVGITPTMENDESVFQEGRALYRKHRKLERDSRIGRLAKDTRIKKVGKLSCDACGFSFERAYGPRGAGFIEAHHTIPVSELRGKKATRVSYIVLVCANCHRILHRTRPWLGMAELRKIVNSRRRGRTRA